MLYNRSCILTLEEKRIMNLSKLTGVIDIPFHINFVSNESMLANFKLMSIYYVALYDIK